MNNINKEIDREIDKEIDREIDKEFDRAADKEAEREELTKAVQEALESISPKDIMYFFIMKQTRTPDGLPPSVVNKCTKALVKLSKLGISVYALNSLEKEEV